MPPNPIPPDDSPESEPIHPDLLAWARQTFDIEEFLDGVRDIKTNGGKQLEDFIAEIEAVVFGA